jgi:hypothetical protein
VFEWLIQQWPLAVAGALAAMGIAAWVERLKKVQELELKIRQLQREEVERSSRIVKPTADEVQQYGRPSVKNLRKVIRRPELFLGVLAILGPLAAAIYQQYLVAKRIRPVDTQLAQVQSQLDLTDQRIAAVIRELETASDQALRELSGTGASRRLGEGPIYRELRRHQNAISQRLDALQGEKDRLQSRKATLVLEKQRLQVGTPWR